MVRVGRSLSRTGGGGGDGDRRTTADLPARLPPLRDHAAAGDAQRAPADRAAAGEQVRRAALVRPPPVQPSRQRAGSPADGPVADQARPRLVAPRRLPRLAGRRLRAHPAGVGRGRVGPGLRGVRPPSRQGALGRQAARLLHLGRRAARHVPGRQVRAPGARRPRVRGVAQAAALLLLVQPCHRHLAQQHARRSARAAPARPGAIPRAALRGPDDDDRGDAATALQLRRGGLRRRDAAPRSGRGDLRPGALRAARADRRRCEHVVDARVGARAVRRSRSPPSSDSVRATSGASTGTARHRDGRQV